MKPGVYRHYKGKLYLVLFLARHSETQEEMVVYVPLYEIPGNVDCHAAVRPRAMFEETVQGVGIDFEKQVPRFEYIGSNP